MRHLRWRMYSGMVSLLFLFSLQCACGSRGTSASPICATQASATAEAWGDNTQVSNQQVWSNMNGGPVTMLSNFNYPLGLPNENQYGPDSLNFLAWAPDARHLAVLVGVPVGPTLSFFPYLVDTHTHAEIRILLPSSALASIVTSGPYRLLAWASTRMLLIVGEFSGGSNGSGGTVTYRYESIQHHFSALPGVTTAAEGVVRCSMLFYLELTPLTSIGNSTNSKGLGLVRRYDLLRQRQIGPPLPLGDTSTYQAADPDRHPSDHGRFDRRWPRPDGRW